uniref:C-type lectin domain-containing protein n=1 Tax=Periophthalmus magnuspinnatus TaxID=409849 RepID=A0A3B3ZFY8_9GOBI
MTSLFSSEIFTLGGNAFGGPCQFPFKFASTCEESCLHPTGRDQPSFCPNHWVPYSGNCYYLDRSKKMWKDALSACHKEGGDLASIANIEEQSFIVSQMGYLPTDVIWIGLNDQKNSLLFEWSDRSPFEYENWGYGEPNNHNDNEHCTELNSYYGRPWNDRHCGFYSDWICQIRKGKNAYFN